MAKITKLVDDLDGVTDAEMTLTFGLDGNEYEIDLADENYEKYYEILNLLASKGRPVTRQVAMKRTLSGKKTPANPGNGDKQKIREFLRSKGHQVADKGRISESLMAIWKIHEAAQKAETPAEEAKVVEAAVQTPEVAVDPVEAKLIEKVKATPAPKTTRGKAKPVKAEIPELREVLSTVGGE